MCARMPTPAKGLRPSCGAEIRRRRAARARVRVRCQLVELLRSHEDFSKIDQHLVFAVISLRCAVEVSMKSLNFPGVGHLPD